MNEQELMPTSTFRLWKFAHKSFHSCKNVERKFMRYYARYNKAMYCSLKNKLGFECKDYYSRGE